MGGGEASRPKASLSPGVGRGGVGGQRLHLAKSVLGGQSGVYGPGEGVPSRPIVASRGGASRMASRWPVGWGWLPYGGPSASLASGGGGGQRWPVGDLLASRRPGGLSLLAIGLPPQWGAYRAVSWPVRGSGSRSGAAPKGVPRSRCGVASGQWEAGEGVAPLRVAVPLLWPVGGGGGRSPLASRWPVSGQWVVWPLFGHVAAPPLRPGRGSGRLPLAM